MKTKEYITRANKTLLITIPLASAGFYHKLGVDFNDHFQVDSTDRKFRRHVMLVGVSRPYNYNEVRNQIQTWLEPGKIRMLTTHFEFVKVDRIYHSIIFKAIDKSVDCRFTIIPAKRIINPCLTIEDWNGNALVEVTVNGIKARIKSAKEGNNLLIWIQTSIEESSEILIHPI